MALTGVRGSQGSPVEPWTREQIEYSVRSRYCQSWETGELREWKTKDDFHIAHRLPLTAMTRKARDLRGCAMTFGRMLPAGGAGKHGERGSGHEPSQFSFRMRVCLRPFDHEGAHSGPIMYLHVPSRSFSEPSDGEAINNESDAGGAARQGEGR